MSKLSNLWKKQGVRYAAIALASLTIGSSMNTSNVDEFKNQNQQLTQQVADLQEEKQQVEEKYASLESEKVDLEKENTTLQNQNEETDKELVSLKKKNKSLKQKAKEAQAKADELAGFADQQETINSLNQQLTAVNAEKESLQQQVADLQSQVNTDAANTAAIATTQQAEPAPETDTDSYTVYITNTGGKYHRDGCSYLRQSKNAISKSDAVARGYTPCSRCNP